MTCFHCFSRFALLGLLGLFLCAPSTLLAQAPPSNTTGLFLNLHLNGSAISFDDDTDSEAGAGLGAKIGYGFSPLFTLYLGLDGASVDSDAVGENYALAHADLMGQFNFGAGRRAFVPYVEAGISGRSAAIGGNGASFTITGGGVSIGGGFKYFFSTPLALDVHVGASFGSFTQASLRGDGIDLGVDIDQQATTSRLGIGLSWYPR